MEGPVTKEEVEGAIASKPKRCIICEKNPATHCIKGTTDCYCKKCALDKFKYLNYLEKM